jgi:hypothetical protein
LAQGLRGCLLRLPPPLATDVGNLLKQAVYQRWRQLWMGRSKQGS